jgi:general secretion pathway protein D
VRLGTGNFINPRTANPPASDATDALPDVDLSFAEADIKEVAMVILGELLGETYFVDPAVKGKVTMSNQRPIMRNELLPILEVMLEMNGAALVKINDAYQIVPMARAKPGALPPVTGATQPPVAGGYTMQVIPLRYVAAAELEKILEPFVPEGGALTAVPQRNVLMFSGPSPAVADFLATVKVFDADWLAGMSMAMLPIEYAQAADIVDELSQLLQSGDDLPLGGMVKLFPVERLNAVLVVTPQRRYLAEVRRWVAELDRGGDLPGRRLYVYEVQNGNAGRIAAMLREVFAAQAPAGRVPEAKLAPGLKPVRISKPAVEGTADASSEKQPGFWPTPPAPDDVSESLGVMPSTIQIIADEDNNLLLVLATRQEYAVIESAIRRLDVLPRQVLVEATIAEVQLTDSLSYGVQWFLKAGLGGYDVDLRSVTGSSPDLPVAAAPGFSLAVFKTPADVRVFIDALETESDVNVLSSPQVLVTDNQTANIRVGASVPVTARRATSSATGDAIIQEVDYRDTGVLLTVSPRINAGGMVTMDISQEVSLVGPEIGSTGNVSIDQRTIESSVVVRSGETIVLGGLIEQRRSNSVTGIPVLSQLPVIGSLFGTTTDTANRAELIVLITPRVIRNPNEAREVTLELRQRLGAVNASPLRPP